MGSLERALDFGISNELLDGNGKAVKRNLEQFLQNAEAEYRRQRLIDCETVSNVVKELDRATRTMRSRGRARQEHLGLDRSKNTDHWSSRATPTRLVGTTSFRGAKFERVGRKIFNRTY